MDRKKVSKHKRRAGIGRRLLSGAALLGLAGVTAIACGGGDGSVGSSVAAGTLGGVCMVERFQVTKPSRMTTLNCTSNDVQLAQYTVVDGPDECFEGEDVTLTLQGKFVATSAERYDVGVFVHENGGTPNSLPSSDEDTCYLDYLNRVSDNNNDLDLIGGAGPFYNGEISEDPGDLCGDIEQGVDTFFNTDVITIKCQDSAGGGPNGDEPDGTADVGTCTVWANSRSAGIPGDPSCINENTSDPIDATPGGGMPMGVTAQETSKCTCGNVEIGGLTVRKTATIEVVKNLPFRYLEDSFDLQIDGVTEADNAIDGGTTGQTTVSAGTSTDPGATHTVGEVAGMDTGGTSEGTDLNNYVTSIACVDRGEMTFNGGPPLIQADAGPLTVPVDPDDDIVCTITNEIKQGNIIVKKETVPNPDLTDTSFGFTTNYSAGFSLKNGQDNDSGDLLPDTYSVSETVPAGWDLISATCDDGSDPSAIGLEPGEMVTCTFINRERARVNVLKLTGPTGAPVVNPDSNWTFSLWDGPDGFGGSLLATDNTFGDLDGVLDFGDTTLDPTATYTLCEEQIPAGFTVFWQVDTDGDGIADTTVIPYNPNADDTTPQDLGNRCVDFGADTGIDLLAPGETLDFQVENTFPGGEARTPGYWKNWNRCSGGGQAANADRNGGYQNGFWLLEDVLDPNIGGGIVWDDILVDDFLFAIAACEDAVNILDQRDLDTGRKRASDAAYTLAMHLLAAQLNLGAGAAACQEALDAALAAEILLDEIDFDGTGKFLRPKDALYQVALDLAATLDAYNNNELCTP